MTTHQRASGKNREAMGRTKQGHPQTSRHRANRQDLRKVHPNQGGWQRCFRLSF